MSRSALVTIRWSNTKLPLSEPATSRSEGSHWRRSSSAKISSSGRSRSSGGTHAGIHSQSASKWQSSVSVSRRAGPPHRGQVGLHEVLALRQRVAGARWFEVEGQQHGQLLLGHGHGAAGLAVDDRDRRAPGALAGDREVVGAVAHRRAQARDRRRVALPRVAGAAVSASLAASSPDSPALVGVDRRPPAATAARRSARRCGRARGCRARRSRRSARRRRARSAPAAARRWRGRAAYDRCRSAGSPRRCGRRARGRPSAAPRSARASTDRPPSARRRDAWARSRRSAPAPARRHEA